ncbi:hypothetical protein [Nocardioides sp.]|uniref:hypothetical protein n=1 Tax=Nocardioides sp. TaxID=35761 RepID=UPI002735CB58|nr:hypothetical protein [Nocardioides sp.]MDP3892680.1 hypothetical protein [Nocardioides sp.]
METHEFEKRLTEVVRQERRRARRHLSLVAGGLVVAMAGMTLAPVAASHLNVRTSDIAKGAVTAPKIKKNAVTTAKIRNNAVKAGKIADNSVPSTKTSNEAGIAFRQQRHSPALPVGPATEVGAASLRVPSDGWVTVHAELRWTPHTVDQDTANCQITRGSAVTTAEPFFRLTDLQTSYPFAATTSAHRTFRVARTDNPAVGGQTFRVVCNAVVGSITVAESQTTVHFFPTSYGPVVVLPRSPASRGTEAELQSEMAEGRPTAEATD